MTVEHPLEAARRLPIEERTRLAARLLEEGGAPAVAVEQGELIAMMREAMSDKLFIADLTKETEDFRHADERIA